MANQNNHAIIAVVLFSIFVATKIASAVRHGQNVIWAQSTPSQNTYSRLVGINGDPLDWVKSMELDVRHISAPHKSWQFRALSFMHKTQTLYWSESHNKRIQGLRLNGSSTTSNLFTGTSPLVDGLAVDWLSNNIYWTDALYNWIVMTPINGPTVTRFVITDDLDEPHGLAIYPQKGSLFWCDGGRDPKIETSDLLGRNRRVVVSTHIEKPRGLTIDYHENVLYWVDAAKDTIESVNFNGEGRRKIQTKLGTNFYGITLYDKFLFVTEQERGHLRVNDKTTGKNYVNYQLSNIPYGIIMYDDDSQPGDTEECDNIGCEHMCVHDPLVGPSCVCATGYKLHENKTSCVDLNRFVQPSHFYTTKVSVCQYPAHLPDMSLKGMTMTSQCFLDDKRGYLALAYDARDNTLYYSENTTGSRIQMVKLEQGSVSRTVSGGGGVIEGVAVDWAAGNVYWTDSKFRKIYVATKSGLYERTLVDQDISHPVGIAVHPKRRKLYWSDSGIPAKIEESELNGEFRRTLIDSKDLGSPRGIYLDVIRDILYWADAIKNRIASFDLNTKELNVIYSDPSTTFIGISVFQDYALYTATGTSNGVHAVRMDTKEKVRGIIHPKVGEATDIITFDKANQPDVASPCSKSNGNGGCQQLCLPGSNDTDVWCFCGMGYNLDENRKTCSSSSVADRFLLITDAYKKQIFHLRSEDGKLGVVDLARQDRPVGIDFDPYDRKIYWTDNTAKVIKMAGMDGMYERVVKALPKESTTDGIALDYINRLVYFTDTGLDIIGVISMTNYTLFRPIVTEDLDEPRSIVVDPQRGAMYWTDWGSMPRIEYAQMDGTDRSTVVNLELKSWPNGLALDREDNRLYWIDAKHEKIESILTNGMDRQLLIQEKKAHYFDLTLMGKYVYITDWTRRSVMRMPKNGHSLEKFGPAVFGRANGITAYNSSETIIARSVCATRVCGHFCVPKPYQHSTCICMDGYDLAADGSSCNIVTTTTTTTTPIPTTASDNSTTNATSRQENTSRRGSTQTTTNSTTSTQTTQTSPSETTKKTTSETTTIQSTTELPQTAISTLPSVTPLIIDQNTTDDDTQGIDVDIGKTASSTSNKSGGNSMIIVVVVSVIAVAVAIAILLAIVITRKRKNNYNPHTKLGEDRSDSFYQITFSDTSARAEPERGIENPTFDCLHGSDNPN